MRSSTKIPARCAARICCDSRWVERLFQQCLCVARGHYCNGAGSAAIQAALIRVDSSLDIIDSLFPEIICMRILRPYPKESSPMPPQPQERRSTLLAPRGGFIVPGGRFREIYYWDTYWVVLGLLSVGMRESAMAMCNVLLDQVRGVAACLPCAPYKLGLIMRHSHP